MDAKDSYSVFGSALQPGSLFWSSCLAHARTERLPLEPENPDLMPQRGASVPAGGDLVTSDPQVFAEALRAIDNENEVLVILKNSDFPRLAADLLRELPLSADLAIALPETPADAPRRHRPGFAPAGEPAHNAVLQALAAHDVHPYRHASWAEVMAIRIPDEKLVPVLAMLLHHPNVDYLEANQKRPIVLDGGFMFGDPAGSNPADIKHTFHDVLKAWDYTRGTGAKVGIIDSGFAYDRSTGGTIPMGNY
jgi:hypothetical protein